MSPRLLVAVLALVSMAGLTGFLVYLEITPDGSGVNRIAPAERKPRTIKETTDPLFDMRYSSAERKTNLGRMGLSDDLITKIELRIRRLEDREKQRLVQSIDDAEDPKDLTAALCGRTSDLRPRYGALRFLVEEDRGTRRAVDLRRLTRLERQEWSRADLIGEVYRQLELTDGRKPDAPLMGVAAILLKKENDALQGLSPWDRTNFGSWSWDDLKAEHPGIEERTIDYFALMHLVVEIAQAEGGLCGA